MIQKEGSAWIPKGFEIAWDQFIIKEKKPEKQSSVAKNDLLLFKSDVYELKNDLTDLKIDSLTGEIVSWKFNGKLITDQPLHINFWRPPTDNDLGNQMNKWAISWQKASYHYTSKLTGIPNKESDGYSFVVAYILPEKQAKVILNYRLVSDGSLEVNYNFSPERSDLPLIPRIGMYLILPDTFADVEWYGRGPEESYWDRKSGMKIGIYEGKIKEQFHRYSRPQETGNKTDVRWIKVSSEDIELKAFGSTTLLNSSTWPFLMTEIDFDSDKDGGASASGLVPVTKKHGADIKLDSQIQWNIDYLQMGVGGDTSWGRPVHKEYTIPANQNYHYSFTIKPKVKD